MTGLKGPSFITVTQLNFYVKSLLDADNKLKYVFVTGEISNLTDHYSSGHIYLSLKDEKSTVKAVMFSYSAKNLRFRPQNGMKVIVRGRVTLYEPTGMYQLYIEDMQPDGIGALTLQYEQLKEKLSKEGLFDEKYKKPLPEYPKVISVITSPTGAALQDIRNILSRRWPFSFVEVTPSLVQGDGAPAMLSDAVRKVNAQGKADVIIIGRGGGSIEDLWAFNSEELARAIFESKIPVISAVGHETDFTICDFVSDMRAPTPSAAAELATPDRFIHIDLLNKQRQYLSVLGEKILRERETQLDEIRGFLVSKDPRESFYEKITEFSLSAEKFRSASENLLTNYERNLKEEKLRLFALSPTDILKRGYSHISKKGKTVSSVKLLSSGDTVDITLSDGKVSATIN